MMTLIKDALRRVEDKSAQDERRSAGGADMPRSEDRPALDRSVLPLLILFEVNSAVECKTVL
jgi:hypothetical protein